MRRDSAAKISSIDKQGMWQTLTASRSERSVQRRTPGVSPYGGPKASRVCGKGWGGGGNLCCRTAMSSGQKQLQKHLHAPAVQLPCLRQNQFHFNKQHGEKKYLNEMLRKEQVMWRIVIWITMMYQWSTVWEGSFLIYRNLFTLFSIIERKIKGKLKKNLIFYKL